MGWRRGEYGLNVCYWPQVHFFSLCNVGHLIIDGCITWKKRQQFSIETPGLLEWTASEASDYLLSVFASDSSASGKHNAICRAVLT